MTYLPDLGLVRHGTKASARSGCDCVRCMAARKKANRVLASLHPLDPRHGTTTGYDRHACRCDKCRAARREADQRRRQERKAS